MSQYCAGRIHAGDERRGRFSRAPVLPGGRGTARKVSATGKACVCCSSQAARLCCHGRSRMCPRAGTLVPACKQAPHRTNFVWRGHAERQTYGELARAVGQIPFITNALNTGRPQAIGSHSPSKGPWRAFASRYIDEQKRRSFLSVMVCLPDFSYGVPEISAKKLSAKTLNAELRKNSADAKPVLTVTANVSKHGQNGAEEVVQLYVPARH